MNIQNFRSQKEQAFEAERQKNPTFQKGEQLFKRLFVWWSVFNIVVAIILVISLFYSGNAYLQLILSAAGIPIICAAAMLLAVHGMRGFSVLSLIGGVFGLLNGILLLRADGFAVASAMSRVYVFVLIIAAAIQIALSLFLFVNRTLGEYFYRKKKIEEILKGHF